VATVAYPDIEALRRLTAERGGWIGDVESMPLARLLDHVGDIDLTATALTMDPRPEWLTEVLETE